MGPVQSYELNGVVCHQKTKTGVSVAPQKEFMSAKKWCCLYNSVQNFKIPAGKNWKLTMWLRVNKAKRIF